LLSDRDHVLDQLDPIYFEASEFWVTIFAGVGKPVPFWVYWTSPEKVAITDHIPNGWVMFNGDI
jgi:hypothetical protein